MQIEHNQTKKFELGIALFYRVNSLQKFLSFSFRNDRPLFVFNFPSFSCFCSARRGPAFFQFRNWKESQSIRQLRTMFAWKAWPNWEAGNPTDGGNQCKARSKHQTRVFSVVSYLWVNFGDFSKFWSWENSGCCFDRIFGIESSRIFDSTYRSERFNHIST